MPRRRMPKPGREAERRQLTVMFTDLVDSTKLAARLDPEDMKDVIARYQKAVGDEVARFGGYVAKPLGDGLLIYFGWPQAHEDDAERAVRSAMAAVAAVRGLTTPAGAGIGDAHRHRDWRGSRRRFHGFGSRRGRCGSRRDPEPGSASPGRCHREYDRRRRGDAPADRPTIHFRRSWRAAPEGIRQADPRLAGRRRAIVGKPVRRDAWRSPRQVRRSRA